MWASMSTRKANSAADVRFGEAEPVVEAITPVPGGVGTVTTSVLVSHVVEAAELHHNNLSVTPAACHLP